MQASTVSHPPHAPGVHVGCSGWVYRHWRGIFYPEGLPQRRWFERYAEEFDTVEINASFYRLPLASTFDGWRDKAPPGFRYAVKVNRFITHMKKLVDCEESLDAFVALARPLRQTLGPLLYQLPPSLHKDLSRLEAFLERLPADLEQVVEFRHSSWYDDEVWSCWIAMESASSAMTSRVSQARAGRAAERPMSAFTAAAAAIRGAIRTKR